MKEKETFSELYARLYTENFNELEALRAKEKRNSTIIIFIIAGIFIFASINPIFILLLIVALIVWGISQAKRSPKNIPVEMRQKTYREVFKEKIVTPIIEHTFEGAKYDAVVGMQSHEYRRAGYNESYDRYHSEDSIIAPLKVNNEVVTSISFAEVHTERESKDSDGDTTYVTVFYGLAGSFLVPKSTGKKIYIRANGRVSNWNKNKVKMDMTEFEKIFDVESDDPILTMRILTSDVMAEMIDLYQKYKYRFEINILDDTVYMRLRTGPMFEPRVFEKSMEYKQIEKYYLVLKALTNIAGHMYDTIAKLEI